MANIFDQYGIKEVADVMIYKLEGNDKIPFLYLDTLKVSTLEQTAEQTEARGGKGNSPLIIWDFGKEINITLEDALYSPRSMAMTWGGSKAEWKDKSAWTTTEKVIKSCAVVADTDETLPTNLPEGIPTGGKFYDGLKAAALTAEEIVKGNTYIYQYEVTVSSGARLSIGADDFPGTYMIVGDTYARNRDTGEDEFFQFIIHRAKMSAENTLTLEAEGDPTVFNLNLRTLRPKDGKMIELIQYKMDEAGE